MYINSLLVLYIGSKPRVFSLSWQLAGQCPIESSALFSCYLQEQMNTDLMTLIYAWEGEDDDPANQEECQGVYQTNCKGRLRLCFVA